MIKDLHNNHLINEISLKYAHFFFLYALFIRVCVWFIIWCIFHKKKWKDGCFLKDLNGLINFMIHHYFQKDWEFIYGQIVDPYVVANNYFVVIQITSTKIYHSNSNNNNVKLCMGGVLVMCIFSFGNWKWQFWWFKETKASYKWKRCFCEVFIHSLSHAHPLHSHFATFFVCLSSI